MHVLLGQPNTPLVSPRSLLCCCRWRGSMTAAAPCSSFRDGPATTSRLSRGQWHCWRGRRRCPRRMLMMCRGPALVLQVIGAVSGLQSLVALCVVDRIAGCIRLRESSSPTAMWFT